MKSELVALFYELKSKYPNELKGYTFGFDNAVRRLGSCNYRKRFITISNKHLTATSKAILINTLKHEVAHAYSFYHHKDKGRGHNGFFYNACRVIGAEPKRCASVSQDIKMITPKYVGVCKVCNNKRNYYRLPKRRFSCGRCSEVFDVRFLIEFVKFEDIKNNKEKGE
jgi:predicted SprT family Zn-dependent metalloprotease